MLNRIKFLRSKKNISQYKLAEITGLSQSQISKIENGKRSIKDSELIKIAFALNISAQELFFNDNKNLSHPEILK